ncbi:MAG: DUF4411 family protein [Methanosphaera stadtmanae]|nr:DUF4411 family protein [Methanosphaera stadtmanae]
MDLFIFDTNILIDLDKYNPKIFPSLWDEIISMIEKGTLFSINEVEREISKKDDRIKKRWDEIDKNYGVFRDLSDCPNFDRYCEILQELEQFTEFQNHGINKEVWADPYLIAVGKVEDIIVVSGEKTTHHPTRKIPYVCERMNVTCMDLDGFMIYNKWQW